MLISRERSKTWKNCKSHYLFLLAKLGDEANLIFSFISTLTSKTLFRTSVTRAGVKNLCCNSAKNVVFVQYSTVHCLYDCNSVLYNSTYLNVASHKFVLCYIWNIFSTSLVLKNYKTMTIRYLLNSKFLKNFP